MSSQTIEIISTVVLCVISLIWIFWVSYTLYQIKNRPSGTSQDFPKKISETLSPYFIPNNQNINPKVPYFINIISKLDSIIRQNNEYSNTITSLRDREQKISELLKEKKSLEERLDSIGNKLNAMETKISESEDALVKLRQDNQLSLSAKDEQHKQNVLDIIEINRQEAKKDRSTIETHINIIIPTFVKSTLEEEINHLYNEVILNHPEAISVWTSLGSFRSSYSHGASPEFTFQILKQLGFDLVKYFALSANSNPQFIHEKLSKWADCLNTNSNSRFSLFIPAINAPINNALMQSISASVNTVTEVMCWGVRNPNGIIYSSAVVK
jgi:hypothetical protein